MRYMDENPASVRNHATSCELYIQKNMNELVTQYFYLHYYLPETFAIIPAGHFLASLK